MMISTEIREVFNQLKHGQFDPSQTTQLERLLPTELMNELRESHSITFQEREIGQKHEVGMARKISWETSTRQIPGSHFSRVNIFPSLKTCVLISSYANLLSEITVLSGIQIRPKGGPSLDVRMKLGYGSKLDKTPDGWFVKPLKNRSVTLSESFLLARGWKFEVFGIFATRKSR